MEALIAVVTLVALGLLARRFGADSRPALRSEEHRFALAGMLWDAPARPHAPVVRSLLWEPTFVAGASPSFPTLRALDRARDPGQPLFATDPDAERLERRARQLTDQHWSEFAWLTGRIDQGRFDLVCDALDRERRDLRQGDEAFAFDQASPIAS